jgi:aldehyde dehydrogenase (NAD+)
MNSTQKIHPAFLDGKVKGLFINGQSQSALSGKTFETISPSNGELLAIPAQAGKEDRLGCCSSQKAKVNGVASNL